MSLLVLENLGVSINGTPLLDNINLTLEAGTRIGLVGESGSGKTLMALAIMGLLPQSAAVHGHILFEGDDLVYANDRQLRALRGSKMSMVFQEPQTALNPTMQIAAQVAEPLMIHHMCERKEARRLALDLLHEVGLSGDQVANRYPHELSGGQKQRVVIAQSLITKPVLLLADEPTTALDVTVQQEILKLLNALVRQRKSAMLFVSHDLGVVSQVCDRVVVLYGGHVMETGPTEEVMRFPKHPYTAGLIAASPSSEGRAVRGRPLQTIPGDVPGAGNFPTGCVFRNRCPRATDECCVKPQMTLSGRSHTFACWHPLDFETSHDANVHPQTR